MTCWTTQKCFLDLYGYCSTTAPVGPLHRKVLVTTSLEIAYKLTIHLHENATSLEMAFIRTFSFTKFVCSWDK